jgi:cellobiose phosphorylase
MHVGYMREHLLCPDGAHLFDKPPRYQGGPQRFFQRAESSAFFGREIGLMYVHAHLRYAEAMAHVGDAEAFFLALRQANPFSMRSTVPIAALRQSNCYYSSSDPVFADRYEAYARYSDVKRGTVPLQGGWRVYSSGAGISLHLIRRCFLGLRPGKSHLVIDPVMPRVFDGLVGRSKLAGRAIKIVYRIKARGCGPVNLSLNGRELKFEREPNPYRPGGARVPVAVFQAGLVAGENELIVTIG